MNSLDRAKQLIGTQVAGTVMCIDGHPGNGVIVRIDMADKKRIKDLVDSPKIRFKYPGGVYTQDIVAGRMNIVINEHLVITSVYYG